jgi:hypothetical protein
MIEWLNDCCWRFWRQTQSFCFMSTRNDQNLSWWSFYVKWRFKTELWLEWNHLLEDITRAIVFTIDQFWSISYLCGDYRRMHYQNRFDD